MAVLAVVGLLIFGVVSKGQARLEVGDQIPDAELSTLDGSGTGSIADYRGDWVLVNVWASWCAPCRDESPALERFYDEHRKDGVTVLGIDSRDVTDDALDFVDEFGLSYPQLHDSDGDRPDALKMTGFPENFLVDPEGKVALVYPQPVTTKSLNQYFAPLIEDEGA